MKNIFYIPSGACYNKGFQFIEIVINILASSESLEFASAELDQVYTEKCLLAAVTGEEPTGELEQETVTLPSGTPAGGGDTGGPHTRPTPTTAATTSTTKMTSPEIEPKYGGDKWPE